MQSKAWETSLTGTGSLPWTSDSRQKGLWRMKNMLKHQSGRKGKEMWGELGGTGWYRPACRICIPWGNALFLPFCGRKQEPNLIDILFDFTLDCSLTRLIFSHSCSHSCATKLHVMMLPMQYHIHHTLMQIKVNESRWHEDEMLTDHRGGKAEGSALSESSFKNL